MYNILCAVASTYSGVARFVCVCVCVVVVVVLCLVGWLVGWFVGLLVFCCLRKFAYIYTLTHRLIHAHIPTYTHI